MLAVKIEEKIQTSAKVKEQVAPKIITEKVCKQGSKGIKQVPPVCKGFHHLQVSIGTHKYKPRQITLVDMTNIQELLGPTIN